MGWSNSVLGFAWLFSSQDLENHHGGWLGLNKKQTFQILSLYRTVVLQ